ncbi:MAG: hypothetical protein ACFFAO_05525 [Candidatus Hermodarchaeota archaeon]
MSQQIDDIISKYKKVFKADHERIKKFLKSYYENVFLIRPVINVERIDRTDRIELSGFNKHLSSWKNFYQNLVVCSCVLINNVQKRYDYKFYFTKEKLNEATIELIEQALEESARLQRDFKFNEAIAKIEEMLELIRKKNDEVTNNVLNDARAEIIASQEKFNKTMATIEKLDEKIKVAKEYDNLKDIPSNCEKIIKLAESINRRDLMKKYKDLSDETQKEIERKKAHEKAMAIEEKKALAKQKEKESYEKATMQIAQLEEKIKNEIENDNLKAAISDCEKIIEIANLIDNKNIADKYSGILEKLEKGLEAQEARERELAIKSKEVLKKRKAEQKRKALEAKAALKRQKAEQKQKELDVKKKLKRQKAKEKQKTSEAEEALKKQKALEEQEALQRQKEEERKKLEIEKALKAEKEKEKENEILEQIAKLENNVRYNQKNANLDAVIKDCKKIIKLANSIDRDDIAGKYRTILNDTQILLQERKTVEKQRVTEEKETIGYRTTIKEIIANYFLIILCIVGGLLIIISATLDIILLISTIYPNINVDIIIANVRLETRDTFFIFLLINACICIVSGLLIILGSIGLISNKLLFGRAVIIYGIFIVLIGAPSILIVGTWAGFLSGNYASWIIIHICIYFIICLVGVVLIDFALWRIKKEVVETTAVREFITKKRNITQKKIKTQKSDYRII